MLVFLILFSISFATSRQAGIGGELNEKPSGYNAGKRAMEDYSLSNFFPAPQYCAENFNKFKQSAALRQCIDEWEELPDHIRQHILDMYAKIDLMLADKKKLEKEIVKLKGRVKEDRTGRVQDESKGSVQEDSTGRVNDENKEDSTEKVEGTQESESQKDDHQMDMWNPDWRMISDDGTEGDTGPITTSSYI